MLAIFFMTLTALAQDKPEAITVTPATTGSLWMDRQSRRLAGMEGGKAEVGDLITVVISEQMSTRVAAGTQSRRDSRVNAGVSSLFGVDSKILSLYPDIGGALAMDVNNTSDFNGDGETTREGLLQGTLTCKVIDDKTNGNLVIFGWKEVRTNQETQYLSLSGVIRPQDIQANNTILSDLVAEARIEYTGSGVVADKQSPGFGTRVVDHVWPF